MRNLCKLFTIVTILLFVVASCEKDGVYNPKKKISRICYSSQTQENGAISTVEKYAQELWYWDNNRLSGISFYDDEGELDREEKYSYDKKNRLSGIDLGGNERCVLTYDRNRLTLVEFYTGNTLEQDMAFFYNDNDKQMSEVKITTYESKAAPTRISPTLFRIFLPNVDAVHASQKLAKMLAENTTKGADSFYIKIEWEGKNITKTIFEDSDYDYHIEYAYDNMKNPYKGLFAYDIFYKVGSENNVVTEREFFDGDIEENTFTYTYDGKYPATKSHSYQFSYEEYHSTFTDTYYYEYK